ncbi:MAG: hypothetical protein ACP5US_06775 [Candidatus Kryptoniota bacterium]
MIVALFSVVVISFSLAAKFDSINSGIGFATGAGLAIVNSAVGLEIIDKNISRNALTFLKIVLLSMGVRMAVLFFSLIILIKMAGIQVIPLVSGLLIYYFAMTIFEIIFLNKRANLQKALRAKGDGL